MNEERVSVRKEGWLMRGHRGHTIFVPNDGRWQFNGDLISPTFSPSINEGSRGSKIGHHFFVENGVVRYLLDKPDGCRGCAGRSEYWTIPPWSE